MMRIVDHLGVQQSPLPSSPANTPQHLAVSTADLGESKSKTESDSF